MIRALLLLIVLNALAACGLKGDPRLPEDAADDYFPQTYPQGAVPREPPELIFDRRRR